MAHETVYLREDWALAARKDAGGLAGFAERLGIDKGTASRQINRKAEASGRFIAAVLRKFSVKFDDAFEVVEPPTSNVLEVVPADRTRDLAVSA